MVSQYLNFSSICWAFASLIFSEGDMLVCFSSKSRKAGFKIDAVFFRSKWQAADVLYFLWLITHCSCVIQTYILCLKKKVCINFLSVKVKQGCREEEEQGGVLFVAIQVICFEYAYVWLHSSLNCLATGKFSCEHVALIDLVLRFWVLGSSCILGPFVQ